MMFAENIPRICIVEQKDIEEKFSVFKEFVYFVYFEKLMEVKRDKNGKLIRFTKAEINRDIPRK